MSYQKQNSSFKVLDAAQMEEQLDCFLDSVLSFRRSAAGPAKQMATLNSKEQAFGLHWVEIISATNAEMAFQFSACFSDAVLALQHDLNAVEHWIVEAMSAFDERGLQFANKVLHNSNDFAETYFKKQQGILLDDIKNLLTAFVCGLNGRSLKIESSDIIYTDTETIYLPELIADFSRKEDNFLYYKLLTVYLWAQNWFGTWRYDLNDIVNEYDDPVYALKLLHNLESIRLIHNIQNELPGFYRQVEVFMDEFNELKLNKDWNTILVFYKGKKSEQKKVTIADSLRLLKQHYGQLNTIDFHFQGLLFANKVQQIKQRRISDEQTRFREALSRIADEKRYLKPEAVDVENLTPAFDFNVNEQFDKDEFSDNIVFELSLDGQVIVPAEDVQSLMSSIMQDIGEIPEEYLVAAGSGQYSSDYSDKDKKTDNVWSGVYHEEGAFFYDEWDYVRQHYKKNWCVVREVRVPPLYDDFVPQTLKQYYAVVKSLRRHFEAIKGEEKLLKRQINGDDIDIDALVESYADMSMGMELNERLFTRMQREDRNIAVMFLVDMSGSTKGWINQAERESLVLLCESLSMLGDRYAIYGFSGTTRKRCEIYHIKHLDEAYNDKVKARISGITAKDYTRMGFAIRHLSGLLEEVEAKTKLLITLSDGKPEDYDGQYRGEYGIEDTRQSLFETRQKGIHCYCITIDKEAGDYLPHMYGAANYALIEDIKQLPVRVSDIYRKLTT
ncbi:MAG: nitric oxide reductase activation protein [gamma proteobacterium symbiont of Taylorina sp.]|nr:nitric oxide reductase activation protein [gamma proteobacterium symbiont of Taylorina sp.]